MKEKNRWLRKETQPKTAALAQNLPNQNRILNFPRSVGRGTNTIPSVLSYGGEDVDGLKRKVLKN